MKPNMVSLKGFIQMRILKIKQKNKPKCPQCSSNINVVEIKYGFPGLEMQDEAAKGQIELGGCVIDEDAPDWYCKECENHF